MADTPKHSVSVAGVVVDDQDRVLVIQRRDNGHWEPPGGVLELNETPEEGVRREVSEETGLQVQVLGLSGVYKNMQLGVVALVFRCAPFGGTITPSTESRQVRWVPRSDVSAMMTEAYAVRVADVFGSGVPLRSHDGTNLTSAT